MTCGPFRAVSRETENDRGTLGHTEIQWPACGTDMVLNVENGTGEVEIMVNLQVGE